MSYPEDLKYTKDHEWVRVKGAEATVGITQYALEQLSDVVHLDLPEIGASYKAGDSFGTIESTKTVSDLYMPMAGKVLDVNKDLLKRLESLEQDPYTKGWLVKLHVSGESATLMSAKDYEKFIAEE